MYSKLNLLTRVKGIPEVVRLWGSDDTFAVSFNPPTWKPLTWQMTLQPPPLSAGFCLTLPLVGFSLRSAFPGCGINLHLSHMTGSKRVTASLSLSSRSLFGDEGGGGGDQAGRMMGTWAKVTPLFLMCRYLINRLRNKNIDHDFGMKITFAAGMKVINSQCPQNWKH